MFITSASLSPAASIETRRFFERQLDQDLERQRRHRERQLEEAAAEPDGSGTMEW